MLSMGGLPLLEEQRREEEKWLGEGTGMRGGSGNYSRDVKITTKIKLQDEKRIVFLMYIINLRLISAT